MLDIYDPNYYGHELSKRQDSLQECLEILQTSMLSDLNRWGNRWKSLSFVPDINDKDFSFSRESYKQKLEEYRKIYPEADWILIFGWFDNFKNCSPKNIKLKSIINDMPIKKL